MKIYVNKDNQALGPFTVEEVQQKIYSGEISWATPGCLEGSQTWKPVEEILNVGTKNNTATAVSHPQFADLSLLRDAKERTAFIWLCIFSIPIWLLATLWIVASKGAALVVILLFWLFGLIAQLFFLGYLKSNAVRVSPSQLPEIYEAVQASCQRLSMEAPEVYVMQQNVWNAFAAKFFKRRVVVLFSGAIDSILLKGDMNQLMWVVGHELGHHWAGHLDWKHRFASLGGWFFWVNLWYSRRRELTCDRVGLYCSGSLRSSQIAMANMTVGAALANKVQTESMIEQWNQHQGEFLVRYRTFYSHYPPLLARMSHLTQAGDELGIR